MPASRGRRGALMSAEADYCRVAESRIVVVFPKVRELLRRQPAGAVLDYGGGDGLFVAEHLPTTVIAAAHFDASPNMRTLARARLEAKADARVRLLKSAAEIAPAAFDAVVMIAVWMELPSERVAARNLRTIARALRPGGHLYAAVTHPCFREERFSTYRTDFDNAAYLRPGTRFHATVHDGRSRSRRAIFADTHWNLDAMSRQLQHAGFAIRRLYELPDAAGARGQRAGRGAPWLIIDAERLPTATVPAPPRPPFRSTQPARAARRARSRRSPARWR